MTGDFEGLLRLNRWISRRKCPQERPLISLVPALVANSLSRGQEKRTMCKPGVQIGNSGLRVYHAVRPDV